MELPFSLLLDKDGLLSFIAFGCDAGTLFSRNAPFVLPPVKPAALR
jgi:hypothetical protein